MLSFLHLLQVSLDNICAVFRIVIDILLVNTDLLIEQFEHHIHV